MTNEELYRNSRMSRENHFRVPDGYFEQLTADVMSRLPELPEQTEQRKSAKHVSLRPLLAAASVACVALIAVGVYFNRSALSTDAAEEQIAATNVTLSDSYIDDAADYVMMDHTDIYAYLASDY